MFVRKSINAVTNANWTTAASITVPACTTKAVGFESNPMDQEASAFCSRFKCGQNRQRYFDAFAATIA